MAMTVLITLTGVGADAGPLFDLYSNADGWAVAFATDVTLADLLAGYNCSVVPDGTTVIKVVAHGGYCDNDVFLTVATTTSTTTVVP